MDSRVAQLLEKYSAYTELLHDMLPSQRAGLCRQFNQAARQGVECDPEMIGELEEMVAQQHQEVQATLARVEAVRHARESYQPVHPEIYSFSLDLLDSTFVRAFSMLLHGRPQSMLELIAEVPFTDGAPEDSLGSELYTFQLFTPEACRMLSAELSAFEKHLNACGVEPLRPNSMNKYGLILEHAGLKPVMDSLLSQVIKPLASMLLPHHGGSSIDHHHSFSVTYRVAEGEESSGTESLDLHVDDAEVTLNVCLSEEFTGGDLQFQDQCTVKHTIGTALLHGGKARHGAEPVTCGERTNLIVWCRSTSMRDEIANADLNLNL